MKLSALYRWCDDVLCGRVVAGRLLVRAVERFQHDIDCAAGRGLTFDQRAAQRALDFFPEMLRHFEGEWAGKPFELEPFQALLIAQLFGWKREGGARRFRTSYFCIARKNGKTPTASGTGLYVFVADQEHGGQIYSAATKRDQANISHRAARHMVRRSSALSNILQVSPRTETARTHTGSIYYPKLDAFWKTIGRDSDTEDGLNVLMGLIDEYHAHPNRGVVGVLETAMGARRQPLMFYITTAGFDRDGPCYEMHKYCTALLDGFDRDDGIKDDSTLALIFQLDGQDEENPQFKDDPMDEAVWRKSNPATFKSMERLSEQLRMAHFSEEGINGFLTKELNIWTSGAKAWMPMQCWRDTPCRPVTLDDLRGRRCWAGLDLASTADTTSLVVLAPRDDEWVDAYVKIYVPQSAVDECMSNPATTPAYRQWADSGVLTVTPGNVTDYSFIEADVLELWRASALSKVGVDRWNSTHLVTNLLNHGVPVELYGQGYASMSGPMKQFERFVRSKKFNHGNHPAYTWQAGNVCVARDSNHNVKPDREASKRKIDAVVATIMAMGMWMKDDELIYRGELTVAGG